MTGSRSIRVPSHRQVLLRGVLRGVIYVLLLLLVANVSAYLIHSVVHPWVTLHRVSAEQRMWERKVAEKTRQLAQLQAKKQWWRSPNGEDELAHQMGLVRPGEHTVVMTPPPPSPPAPRAPLNEQYAGTLELSPTLRLSLLTLFVCALVYGGLLLRRRRLLKIRQETVGVLTPRAELLRRRSD